VLDWYAEESGLTMITTVKPRGTFTVNPPAGREFTLAEITDLLNESLAQQKLILIRRHMTFFIHPADEKIDPTLIPRIELNELPKRGKSEIVQVILPLKTIKVSDIQDEVKKLLTPFGSLVVLEKQNALLIQDTAGNIFRIRAAIEVEHPTGPDDSLDHVCKWQSAQAMADVLKTLLTDKDTTVTVSGMPRTNHRARNVQIAVDARRNALVLTAPPDKLVLAKKIIAELDKPQKPTDKPYIPLNPILKTYTVPPGSAAEVAKKLTVAIAGLQVVPLEKQNQIMVLATPADHERVAKLIPAKGSGKNPEPKSYAVKFQKTPWKDVFAWYATASGLTRVGDSLPSGTFTFVPPAPENPQEVFSPALSLDEVTDYINETLLTRKWLLVRGETTFAVIPADEKVDRKWIRRVKPDELDRVRRTELVEVLLQPAQITIGEVDAIIHQMVGPFGRFRYLDKAHIVEVRDTAGNVRAIVEKLRELEQAVKPGK
jgi:type II secretory pathway component GspD/PulD (secretin)